MQRKHLRQFFRALGEAWPHKTTVLVTGGAAALLLGGARPTDDVDFEVRFHTSGASWEAFTTAVQRVSESTKIGAQYAESIDRWTQITLLDYRSHAQRMGRFGAIEVRLLDPIYWSIGKVSRYEDRDIQDLIAVFRRHQPDPAAVARLWHRALRKSPKSTHLRLTLKQALHFFRTHGKRIWGPRFSLATVEAMLSAAPRSRSKR